jgi:hypothetical protein
MATWTTIEFSFPIFDPLKEPLKGVLTALETISAILEALLELIKPFMIDLTNPLKAIVALLLAAIRTIIDQIVSTGFSVLLVHPDFSRPDFAGVLDSVSGGYASFESKVISKFFDSSDIFRPQFPQGSSVAMLVMYIGATTPGDLMSQLLALLQLLKHPVKLTLPAPVGVKVLPVNKSGSSISQFKNLFDSDLDKALVVEWRMPEAPSGQGVAGLMNQAVSVYNSYRFPTFVVERIGPFPSEDNNDQSPQGELVQVEAESPTLGKSIDPIIERYKFPKVSTKIVVREENGNVYRDFPKKIDVDSGAEVLGALEGTYRYLDDDPELIAGRTYYYRVRPYFGNAGPYLALKGAKSVASNKSILRREGNQVFVRFPPSLTLGQPSRVVKGFVPRPTPENAAFSAYDDVYNAIKVGILLNFELPPATEADSTFRKEQKTGWGSLGQLGGQVGPIKAAFPLSTDLKDNVLLSAASRRLANPILTVLSSTPELSELLSGKWTGGVKDVVDRVLDETIYSWNVIGVVNGVTSGSAEKIDAYLALEDSYEEGKPFNGPVPVSESLSFRVSVQERQDLADFLRTALSCVSSQTSYLSWYGMTLGDLFPALIPFLFDFEQFLLGLLKALESALSELTDIIETLLQKVRALEQILRTILDLLDLLGVKVSLSLLASSSTNGSAASLAQDLLQSDNKPQDSGFGLHSGIVMTFGGPGESFVAAFKALKFILTIG